MPVRRVLVVIGCGALACGCSLIVKNKLDEPQGKHDAASKDAAVEGGACSEANCPTVDGECFTQACVAGKRAFTLRRKASAEREQGEMGDATCVS